MIKTPYINPFSTDAKEIVSKLGHVESLNEPNTSLSNIVSYTRGQNLSNADLLPETIKELALNRFKWFLFRKTSESNEKNYEYLFNPEIYEYDVVAFYLLCQAIAIKYGPDSHESRLVLDCEEEIVSQRLELLKSESNDYQSNFLRKTLNQLIDTNNLYWTDLKEVLDMGKLDLTELILSEGKVILEFEDFMLEKGDLIHNRDPRTMYEVTAGVTIKSKLLINLIRLHTKQYIETVHEMSKRMVEPNQILVELAEDIKEIQLQAQTRKLTSSGSSQYIDDKPVNYEYDAFPPCVKKCMQGIKSGGRNDAIVLFLTPFLSYSRLYPAIFSTQEQNMKISDVDSSLEITHNEIIPLIYEAAQSCSPPLFKDQPQEKININSKLGFGMHSDLKLDHEGETQWYTPMSCEKIKLHMPNLCTPNVDCKKIGNPITFYNRKRRLLKRDNQNKGQMTKNGN
ncbi:MAG: hypothetical protein BZ138_02775 [Methanosphaera sp. rholeuAM270]|nr:MAG: hypothetical protein BZ138_02775 [Methanosphaera sp. rholeuAM270]